MHCHGRMTQVWVLGNSSSVQLPFRPIKLTKFFFSSISWWWIISLCRHFEQHSNELFFMIHSPAACSIFVDFGWWLLGAAFPLFVYCHNKTSIKQTIMMMIMLKAVNFSCQQSNNFSTLVTFQKRKRRCLNLFMKSN